MSECHHGGVGICIICNDGINVCCGDDIQCEICCTSICFDCFNARDENCPVCSQEIVTSDQLLSFILMKHKLILKDVENEYKKENPIFRCSGCDQIVKNSGETCDDCPNDEKNKRYDEKKKRQSEGNIVCECVFEGQMCWDCCTKKAKKYVMLNQAVEEGEEDESSCVSNKK
jgi:hypothetical protein